MPDKKELEVGEEFLQEINNLGIPIWKGSQEVARSIVESAGLTDEDLDKVDAHPLLAKALRAAADYLNEEFDRKIKEQTDEFERVKYILSKKMFLTHWDYIMNSLPEEG